MIGSFSFALTVKCNSMVDLPQRAEILTQLATIKLNRDLKQQDGRHDDGIPEVYFPFPSCTEPEKLTAIRRRPVVGDGTFAVLT